MASIELRDLTNRKYYEKIPIYFEYTLTNPAEKDKELFTARYTRLTDYAWKMQVIMDPTAYIESTVFTFTFSLPKANMPLNYVACVGLKYMQAACKEDIQRKQEVDFLIGDVLAASVVA